MGRTRESTFRPAGTTSRLALLMIGVLSAVLLLTIRADTARAQIIQPIGSTTHPDENTWYSHDDPEFDFVTLATVAAVYGDAARVNDVAVAGDYAYLAAASQGLQVVDISNPSAPALIGSLMTPGSASGLRVFGGYAIVAAGSGGLQIIDISNPAAPVTAGTYDTPDYVFSVTISGDYAYLIVYGQDGSSGLRVIDISNPGAPVFTATLDTPGTAQELVIAGPYAYIADWGGGLQIIDISNPTAPTIIGSYHTPYNTLSVAVSGNYAYLVDPMVGLRIVDVSNPASPALAATRDTAGWYYHVTTSGSYAYLTDGGSALLRAYDISDPASPELMSSIATGGLTREMAVRSEYVLAADGKDGLKIIESNLWEGYSYVLDQSPGTTPDTLSEGIVGSAAYKDLADGIWYMHLRVADSQGTWGAATHRRAAVDTIPPSVTYSGPTGKTDSNPTVTGTYGESEALSGIDAYSASIKLFSNNGFVRFPCSAAAGTISCPLSGLGKFGHEATLSIADNAGNRATDAGGFTISGGYNLFRTYFSWYDNRNAADWVLMSDPIDENGSDLFFDLSIGGTAMPLEPLPGMAEGQAQPGNTVYARYPDLMDGPVEVGYRSGKTDSSDPQAVVSQRILWAGNSLEEVPAIEAMRLSDHFYWTWYDQKTQGYANWVLVANPDKDPVYYELTIAGEDPGPGSSGSITPGESVTPAFPGKMGGPVELRAWTDATKAAPARVMASQRVLSNYGRSFNEQPGIPAEELVSSYRWTWYDQRSPGALDWVLVANPNPYPVYCEISMIPIAGDDPGGTHAETVAPGESVAVNFPGRMGGPVSAQAWTGQDKGTQADIIASQRVIWGPSFDETMGTDPERCPAATENNWTWYDQQTPGSTNWVMVSDTSFAYPSNSYSIWIGQDMVASGSLNPGGSAIHTFPGVMGGPVQVRSGDSVIASQRVLWNGYFNETPGIVLGCGSD